MRHVAVLLAAVLPLAVAAEEPRPLRHDLHVDGAVTAAAFAGWILSDLARSRLASPECRICSPGGLDVAARDALVWRRGDRARRASDMLVVALPTALAAHQVLAARAAGDVREGVLDLLLVAEAVALAGDLNQAVKYAAGRERPSVHFGRDPARRSDPDDNLSFYSSHTSVAFAAACAAGEVSTLRGYRSAPWVWGLGLSAAAAVGYLRIAADEHYLTDVLAGAAIGSAFGLAVPRLLHPREGRAAGAAQAVVVPIPLGVA